MPWPGGMSTGMPRPLSLTWTPPSAQDRDLDPVAVAGQRLVDGVVHDLPHQVVQAALAGGADVHAGALADRLEALEDLDRAGVVGAGLRPRAPRGCWPGTTSGTGGRSGIPEASADGSSEGCGDGLDTASVVSSATKFLFCCAPARESAGRALMATQWPPHGWVGDQGSVYPSAAHNHVCCPGFGGIRRQNCPSEARNRPGQPVRGVALLPIRSRGPSAAPAGALRGRRVSRRCRADPVP